MQSIYTVNVYEIKLTKAQILFGRGQLQYQYDNKQSNLLHFESIAARSLHTFYYTNYFNVKTTAIYADNVYEIKLNYTGTNPSW